MNKMTSEKEILNRYLRTAFDAPPPERKAEFLKRLRGYDAPPLTIMDILKCQIGYVRKITWLLSIVLFAAGLYMLTAAQEKPYVIGAVTPFFALAALAECARSAHYGMAEMEAATRLSLRSVLFARMLLVGLPNLALLMVLARFCVSHMRQDMLLTGAYLLTPFLLTMLCCLLLERSVWGRENPYGFIVVTVLVSLVYLFLTEAAGSLFLPVYRAAWEAAALFSLIGVVLVWKKNLDTWEELSWS